MIRASTLFAWALLLAGCFTSSTEVDSILRTVDTDVFPGSGGAPRERMTHEREIEADVGRSLTSILQAAQVKRMTFKPKSGVVKLDFIESLSVIATGDG